MYTIWQYLRIFFMTSNNRGHISTSDLHRIMDQAIAAGWQPQEKAI